ncbi:hypothetical protein Tco_1080442 [Tanacetum coccineum]|uniref:Uncharacterized protein n=1 Tax=Tanacetum coccineum TaxID=301880 RepID=A0ABQ5HWM4_9ASTR
MSTPTQCCDMGSDGYAYPVYDMFGIVDPNMQNEICLGINLEPDEWIKDSGYSKHMTGNQNLLSTYKAYNGGFNLLSIGQICDNKCRVTFSEHDSEITKDGKVIASKELVYKKAALSKEAMRNLEKFVGGKEYENDLRLLEWTI